MSVLCMQSHCRMCRAMLLFINLIFHPIHRPLSITYASSVSFRELRLPSYHFNYTVLNTSTRVARRLHRIQSAALANWTESFVYLVLRPTQYIWILNRQDKQWILWNNEDSLLLCSVTNATQLLQCAVFSRISSRSFFKKEWRQWQAGKNAFIANY